jgi:hypothetical protein
VSGVRGWVNKGRRPVPVMVAMAVLFAADLPAANGVGRVVNIAILVWYGAFIAWFWTHPRTVPSPPESPAPGENPEPDLRTGTVLDLGRGTGAAVDPVAQARRRFRVRDDEPSPSPSEEGRG